MSKTISIADDVYDWLKREKDREGRSFSEVIRNLKPRKPRFSECNGAGLTDRMSDVRDGIEDASRRTKRRLDDAT